MAIVRMKLIWTVLLPCVALLLISPCQTFAQTTSSDKTAEETEPQEAQAGSEKPEGRRLLKRLGPQPLTPEEQQEAQRLSRIARSQGTDPTAIVGRLQLSNEYDALTSRSRVNILSGRVDVPYGGNWLLSVITPLRWSHINGLGNVDGLGDLFVRTGARLYTVPGYAFFAAADFTFPTATSTQLGLGKYTVSPTGATARVFPDIDSLLFAVLQQQLSIGGDPSRRDVSLSRLSLLFNTIWTERWYTQIQAVGQLDWQRDAKSSLTLEFEGGHRLTREWLLWVRPGVGVLGRDVIGAYEWSVEVGFRRMFASF
ncbi:hypothetical protein [Nitrospira sp. Nam74]